MSQYDKIAEDYFDMIHKGFSPNKHIEQPAMFKLIGDIKNKKLLDLGCGFGDHAIAYAKKDAIVTGLDASKKEIEFAIKQNIPKAKFFVYDLNKKLIFKNNQFDIITCSFVLDHIIKPESLFKECFRILKSKGTMFFSIINPIFYQEERTAGKLKMNFNRTVIFGDYFQRRKIKALWRDSIPIEYYHRTLEDYFNAFLKAGFQLEAFVEPKPLESSKELKPLAYEFTSKNPYVLLFKLKKN